MQVLVFWGVKDVVIVPPENVTRRSLRFSVPRKNVLSDDFVSMQLQQRNQSSLFDSYQTKRMAQVPVLNNHFSCTSEQGPPNAVSTLSATNPPPPSPPSTPSSSNPNPLECLNSCLCSLLLPLGFLPELVLCVTDYLPQGLCPSCDSVHSSTAICTSCHELISWCSKTPKGEKGFCLLCGEPLCGKCQEKTRSRPHSRGGVELEPSYLCENCVVR